MHLPDWQAHEAEVRLATVSRSALCSLISQLSNTERVLQCSGHDYEVIVVDDNSPDGTQDVVKQMEKAFGSERVVRCFRFLGENALNHTVYPPFMGLRFKSDTAVLGAASVPW